MRPPTQAGWPSRARPRGADGQQMAADAARERPRFTSRAAVLIVVVCAIALSLAYPVREYIAQRQQIDQLLALQQANAAQVQALEAQDGRLTQTWYVEQQAEDELHMCFPHEQCYEVITGQSTQAAKAKQPIVSDPWYAALWQSVQRADAEPSR
jgi:cell division protein FtsB